MKDITVTSVSPIKGHIGANGEETDARWLVTGYCGTANKSFSYVCKKLVLANGAIDIPNRLSLKGEETSKAWVKYELPLLERTIERLSLHERANLKPIVVVGAGLTSADAITNLRAAGIQVYHVYRDRTTGLDGKCLKTSRSRLTH